MEETEEAPKKVEEQEEAPKKVEEAPKPKPAPALIPKKKNDDYVPSLSELNINRDFGVFRTNEFENEYYGEGDES